MQIIEQRHVIIGHQPVSDRLVGPGGTALSATVGDDDGMMAGENGKLGIPDVLVGKAAMDQQDRRPLAHDPVIHFNAIDFGKGGRRSGNGHACMAFNRNRRGEERSKTEGETCNP